MDEQHITLPISGMTCANCALTIERVLNKKTPGIVEAKVNLATEKADIIFYPEINDRDGIISARKKAGYGVIDKDTEDTTSDDYEQLARQKEIKVQSNKFWLGVIFSSPLF